MLLRGVRCCGIAAFLLFCGRSLLATETTTGQFVDRVYRDADGDHKYVVFEPAGYTPSKRWPVIFSLHGASGRGRDGRAPLIVGLGPGLKQRAASAPFLAVFPQNENLRSRLLGGWHDDPTELDRALRILEAVERDYAVDTNHRVLVGVSMGAFGAWSLAAKEPSRWKAIIPISGGGRPEFIPALINVPVWAFHAADDTLVKPSASIDLVDGINRAGGRAYVSIVPTGGHNIGSHVFGQDEVFEWMLHPERPATTEIDWSHRPSAGTLLDELPFVPGADVERALQVRVNKDLLESLSHGLPGQVPTDALNGVRPGTAESRGQGWMTFHVTTANLQYTGQLERAWLTPLADNRLRLQLGLRYVTLTVPHTHLESRLISADASAMQIVLGQQEPVWLTADVIPRVENRRMRLEVLNVEFQAADGNWGIAAPAAVRVRPLPFLDQRITQELVKGLAARKPQIEREIRDSVPKLLSQLETRLLSVADRTVTYARFPMPLWQPRFRFYPESIAIDEQGLTISLGATVAALAPRSNSLPILPVPADGEETPVWSPRGLHATVSPRLIAAWSTLLARSDVGRFHVLDMNSLHFRELGQRTFWESVLPDDHPIPADAELETEFVLVKPLRLTSPSANQEPVGAGSTMALEISQLQLQLSLRHAGERVPQPFAEVDLNIEQPLKLGVQRPNHSDRRFEMLLLNGRPPAVRARLCGAPEAQINEQRIAAQFQKGWNATFAEAGLGAALKDLNGNGLALRWEAITWTDDRFEFRLERPAIRVRNTSDQTVFYQVQGQQTPWSDTLSLAPGEFHEFRPPTALTWRSIDPSAATTYTLPLGFDGKIPSGQPLRLVRTAPLTTR